MPGREGVALDVEGVKELRALFNRAAKVGIPLSMKSAHRDIGLLVIAKAKPKLPVSSGAYASSLRASNTAWKAEVKAGGVRLARHAPLIHWGTRYRPTMAARPDIAETAFELGDRIQRLYEQSLENELRKISAD